MSRTSAVLLASAVGAAGVLGLPGAAGAAAVPTGPFTFIATEGQFKVGRAAVTDTVSPDRPAILSGTITGDGSVVIPAAAISLPASTVRITRPPYVADVAVTAVPTAAARGRIDRATGALTSPLVVRADLRVAAFGTTCTISGTSFGLGTGTVAVPSQAAPEPPATVPLSGTPLSGGAFAIAGLSGAPMVRAEPTTAPVCRALNEQLGLPAVAGIRLGGRITAATPYLVTAVTRPRTTTRGRTVALRVTVINRGSGYATGVRMRTTLPKGTSGPRRVRVGTIAPGARRSVSLKLRTTKKASRRSRVTLTVGGDGLPSTTATATLRLR
jgi:hypothetical protein